MSLAVCTTCDHIVGFADDANINEPNCCYCPAYVAPAEKEGTPK